VVMLGSLVIALQGIFKKYSHKLMYLKSNMNIDPNRDSLNINILQNEIAILDEKLKYYNEKYIMTGNAMN